jgi:hypothetical protein
VLKGRVWRDFTRPSPNSGERNFSISKFDAETTLAGRRIRENSGLFATPEVSPLRLPENLKLLKLYAPHPIALPRRFSHLRMIIRGETYLIGEPCLVNDRGRPTKRPAHEAERARETTVGNAISESSLQRDAGL